MKKNYIAPFVEIEEVEDLCQTGMNPNSYDTKPGTPGNDTYIPTDGPTLGGGEGGPPAAKEGTITWDFDFE